MSETITDLYLFLADAFKLDVIDQRMLSTRQGNKSHVWTVKETKATYGQSTNAIHYLLLVSYLSVP